MPMISSKKRISIASTSSSHVSFLLYTSLDWWEASFVTELLDNSEDSVSREVWLSTELTESASLCKILWVALLGFDVDFVLDPDLEVFPWVQNFELREWDLPKSVVRFSSACDEAACKPWYCLLSSQILCRLIWAQQSLASSWWHLLISQMWLVYSSHHQHRTVCLLNAVSRNAQHHHKRVWSRNSTACKCSQALAFQWSLLFGALHWSVANSCKTYASSTLITRVFKRFFSNPTVLVWTRQQEMAIVFLTCTWTMMHYWIWESNLFFHCPCLLGLVADDVCSDTLNSIDTGHPPPKSLSSAVPARLCSVLKGT